MLQRTIIKGKIYLFVSDENLECGNLTLLEFHFYDVEEKYKKINFTRVSIFLLKIKIPHSLFKKRKKNVKKR